MSNKDKIKLVQEEIDKADYTDAQKEAVTEMYRQFPSLVEFRFFDKERHFFEFYDESEPLSLLAGMNQEEAQDNERMQRRTRSVIDMTIRHLLSHLNHLLLHIDDDVETEDDKKLVMMHVKQSIELIVHSYIAKKGMEHLESLLALDDPTSFVVTEMEKICEKRGIKNVYHPCEKVDHPLNEVFGTISKMKTSDESDENIPDALKSLFKNAAKA